MSDYQKGIVSRRKLPKAGFDGLCYKLIVPDGIKDGLISEILLELTARCETDGGALQLRGLGLSSGAPGVGKTTLANAPASNAVGLRGVRIHFLEGCVFRR